MATSKTVTVENDNGERFRIALPKAQWTGDIELGTGIWLQGLFVGKKSGKKVAQMFSQWQQRDGSQRGDYYRLIDESDYLHYCDRAGVEPMGIDEAEL